MHACTASVAVAPTRHGNRPGRKTATPQQTLEGPLAGVWLQRHHTQTQTHTAFLFRSLKVCHPKLNSWEHVLLCVAACLTVWPLSWQLAYCVVQFMEKDATVTEYVRLFFIISYLIYSLCFLSILIRLAHLAPNPFNVFSLVNGRKIIWDINLQLWRNANIANVLSVSGYLLS